MNVKVKYVMLLICTVVLLSCGRREPVAISDNTSVTAEIDTGALAVVNSQPTNGVSKVKVYIENSYSMDGYIPAKVKTDFYNRVVQFLFNADRAFSPAIPTVSLLNNKAVNEDIFNAENISYLNTSFINSKYSLGKGSSSFHEEIQKVIDRHSETDVTVFIADFIHSPKGEGSLSFPELQNFVEGAFQDANKAGKNVNVKILKYSSNFHGIYYDINNTKVGGIEKRPYYMFVFANKENLEKFESDVQPRLTRDSNFEEEYTVVSDDAYDNVESSFLLNTLQKGDFNELVTDGNNVLGVKYRSGKAVGGYNIAVAINMNDIPVGSDYKSDISNYWIEGDIYSIEEIGEIKSGSIYFDDNKVDVHPSDKNRIANKSHVLVFTSASPVLKDFQFGLKKLLPDWIENSSIDDDRNIKGSSDEQKTLGFKYIVQGIFDAYAKVGGENLYFQKELQVQQDVKRNPLAVIILLVFAGIAVLIGLIIYKQKQRQ